MRRRKFCSGGNNPLTLAVWARVNQRWSQPKWANPILWSRGAHGTGFVGREQEIDYRLVLKVRGLPWRGTVLVLLRCLDGVPLEIGRWRLHGRWGLPQRLKGRIDGALINARGIDALWLTATKAPPGVTISGSYKAWIV